MRIKNILRVLYPWKTQFWVVFSMQIANSWWKTKRNWLRQSCRAFKFHWRKFFIIAYHTFGIQIHCRSIGDYNICIILKTHPWFSVRAIVFCEKLTRAKNWRSTLKNPFPVIEMFKLLICINNSCLSECSLWLLPVQNDNLSIFSINMNF